METGIEVQINDTHGKEKVGPHDCGGIIGTSIAFYLARMGAGKVVQL